MNFYGKRLSTSVFFRHSYIFVFILPQFVIDCFANCLKDERERHDWSQRVFVEMGNPMIFNPGRPADSESRALWTRTQHISDCRPIMATLKFLRKKYVRFVCSRVMNMKKYFERTIHFFLSCSCPGELFLSFPP